MRKYYLRSLFVIMFMANTTHLAGVGDLYSEFLNSDFFDFFNLSELNTNIQEDGGKIIHYKTGGFQDYIIEYRKSR